jgi:hypothetical protein
MTTSYNKYFDTYIKQKTTGSISANSKNYSLRNDGKSFLNGDVDISGNLNNVSLTNLSKLVYLDVSSSISTQITNINTILTGATYDNIYNYLNITGNVHIYQKLQLGSITDVEYTINNNITSISNINNNITDIVYDSFYLYTNFGNNVHIYGNLVLGTIFNVETSITDINTYITNNEIAITDINTHLINIDNSIIDANTYLTNLDNSITDINAELLTKQDILTSSSALLGTTLNGSSLANISKLPYLDITSSLTTLLNAKQNTLTLSSALLGTSLNGTSLTNISKLPYLDITSSLTTLLNTKQNTISNISYLDISSNLTTLLNAKQNTITASVDVYGNNVSGNSINIRTYLNVNSVNISAATVSNLQYLDITSSLTTQLANKPTINQIQGTNFDWGGTHSFQQDITINGGSIFLNTSSTLPGSEIRSVYNGTDSDLFLCTGTGGTETKRLGVYSNGVVNVNSNNQIWNKLLVLYILVVLMHQYQQSISLDWVLIHIPYVIKYQRQHQVIFFMDLRHNMQL